MGIEEDGTEIKFFEPDVSKSPSRLSPFLLSHGNVALTVDITDCLLTINTNLITFCLWE